MRNVIFILLIIGLLLGGIPQYAQAQDKKLEFNLNIGGLIPSGGHYHTMFSSGAGLDFHLGEKIMISPELQLWKGVDAFLLNPGAILNYKFENAFVGGGLTYSFFVSGDEHFSSELYPKINIGLRFNRIKFTFYIITSFEDLSWILFGANIGIVF